MIEFDVLKHTYIIKVTLFKREWRCHNETIKCGDRKIVT